MGPIYLCSAFPLQAATLFFVSSRLKISRHFAPVIQAARHPGTYSRVAIGSEPAVCEISLLKDRF